MTAHVICSISGIQLQAIESFGGKIFLSQHPFFTLPLAQINALYFSRDKNILKNKLGTKLLFLALLNHSGLVEFHFPASPSDNLCLLRLASLQTFVSSLEELAKDKPSILGVFPKFTIRADNADLKGFEEILALWEGTLATKYPSTEKLGDQRWIAPSLKLAALFSKPTTAREAKEPTRKEYEWVMNFFELENEQEYYLASMLRYPKMLQVVEINRIIGILNERLENYTANKVKFINWYATKKAELVSILGEQQQNAANLHYGFLVLEPQAQAQAPSLKQKDFPSFKEYLIAQAKATRST